MLDINKSRNNYNTKYTSKCESSAILVQHKKQQHQQHQQHLSKQPSQHNSTTQQHNNSQSLVTKSISAAGATTTNNKKLTGGNNFINDLKPAITVKQIAVHPIIRGNAGIGRGVSIAARIDAAKRASTTLTTPAATATATATETTTTINPVRKANERFFLLPEYQDNNFLKDECAIAHAQVVAATTVAAVAAAKTATTTSSAPSTPPTASPLKRTIVNSGRKIQIKDDAVLPKINYNNSNNNVNNNNNSNSSSNNLNNGISKANITNVMRRSNNGVSSSFGYGNVAATKTNKLGSSPAIDIATTTTGTTATTTTANATTNSAHYKFIAAQFTNGSGCGEAVGGIRAELQTISKSAPPSATSSKSAAAAVAAATTTTTNSTNFGSGSHISVKLNSTLNNKTIKPLVHRSTTSTTTANRTNGSYETSNCTHQVNNNHSSNNNVNNNSSNAIAGVRNYSPTQLNNLKNNNNHNHSNNNNNSMAVSTSLATVTATATKTTTAMATSATLEHDDIKYIDSDEAVITGSPGGGSKGKFVPCLETTTTTASTALKTTSATATTTTSIQKLTTTSAATPSTNRSRPKSTILCTSNHNHHGNAFEKINYKYANVSSSSSNSNHNATNNAEHSNATTATAIRRSTPLNIDSNGIKASIEKFNSFSEQKRLPLLNAVALRAHTGATGSTSNLQFHRHSGSDFDSRQLNNNSGGGGGGGGSLTRNTYRATAGYSTAQSSLLPLKAKVRVSDGAAATATAYKATTNNRQTNSSSTETIATSATDESVRSAATTKSVLPPASPTTSRYWDRDNARTSSLSTLSSTAHNSLDADKASQDEKSEGLCGLRNIGNTCFMNSIIQCLSHTSELTKFLRNYSNGKSSSSSSSTKDQLILQEFARLIREMWTSNVHSVTPMDLKRAFSTKHRMYSDYNQQDAQEFLRFFLDSLHSALNSGVKGEPLRIDDNLSDNKKAELTWDWYTRYDNSLIRDLFVGLLKSTLRCTACGNASVTFDPFWDLSVPLPSSSRCRLDACLDLFIREEVLDGDEMPTCSKCKTRRKCTKSFSIQRFPKYLVIHLKRFSETRWSKLSSIVEFPTGERELNMASYGANPHSSIYYSLYAISNHMGSTAGGHYVALCKHPVSRRWHEFNDNMVSDPISESHLVTSSAYILFYERA